MSFVKMLSELYDAEYAHLTSRGWDAVNAAIYAKDACEAANLSCPVLETLVTAGGDAVRDANDEPYETLLTVSSIGYVAPQRAFRDNPALGLYRLPIGREHFYVYTRQMPKFLELSRRYLVLGDSLQKLQDDSFLQGV